MIGIIDELKKEYSVIGVYGLFSGGHDSLTACHVASKHPDFKGVIHIDTTTGLKETQDFVRQTAQEQGWPLTIKRPYMNYEAFIVRRGFPGPAMHRETYDKLKDRTLRQVTREIKEGFGESKNSQAKIILVSGARVQESNRRAEINTEPHVEGVRLWLPIIADFTATDCTHYIRENGLKRSPVKDKIHMSGECFCGAFARPSEFHELEHWFPEQAKRIRYWESLVGMVAENRRREYEAGLCPENELINDRYCKWGWKDGLPKEQTSMPMCWQCRGSDPPTPEEG